MSSWMEKAKAHFSNSPHAHPPKTPERGVSGVLGACSLEEPENRDLLEPLLQAAMNVCDHWGDGQFEREQMRQDCMDTPAHLRADLIDYFQQEYGAK